MKSNNPYKRIAKLESEVAELKRITGDYKMKSGLRDRNNVEICSGSTLITFHKSLGITGERKKVEFGRYTDFEEYVHQYHYGWHVEGTPILDCLNDGSFVIDDES